MSRYLYGAGPADYAATATGQLVPGARYLAFTSMTGGDRSQVTDLTDINGAAATQVVATASGRIMFYGPDGYRAPLWLQAVSGGDRVACTPVDNIGDIGPQGPSGPSGPATIGGLLTGKGDLAVGKGDGTALRQPAGADGAVVVFDSTQATGVTSTPLGNPLPVNVATGTDALSTTAGFSTRTGVTYSSSTDWAKAGSRSLKIVMNATGTPQTAWGCTATAGSGNTVPANGVIPVTAGATYEASAWVAATGTSTALKMLIYWWTSAGTVAAATASVEGTAATCAATGTRLTVSGTAPADAAYAAVMLVADATVTTAGAIYVDAPDFVRAATEAVSLRPTGQVTPATLDRAWLPMGRWPVRLAQHATRPVNVVMVGDSITEGATAGSLAARFSVLMQTAINEALGLSAGAPAYFPTHYGSGNAPSLSSVVTATGGTAEEVFGLGCRNRRWTSAGSVAFTVTGAYARIHYGARGTTGGTAGGSWRYKIDSGSWTTVTVSDVTVAGEKVTDRFSLGSSGSHTITIEWVSGYAQIAGVEVWESITSGVRVIEAGHGGYSALDHLTAKSYRMGQSEALCDPDLLIVTLGANDANDYDAATFATHLLSVVTKLQALSPTAPVLLAAIWTKSTLTDSAWAAYVASIRSVAVRTGAGFLDLRPYMPLISEAGLWADGTHPNAAGHSRMAAIFTNYLLNAAAGLPAVSEPLRWS